MFVECIGLAARELLRSSLLGFRVGVLRWGLGGHSVSIVRTQGGSPKSACVFICFADSGGTVDA